MPELPEVETVRRGIAPALLGRRLARVEARRPDLRWPLPERFADRLRGRTVTALDRRSKYIIARLDDGMAWLIHLGMSGRIAVAGLAEPESELEAELEPAGVVGRFALAAPTAVDAAAAEIGDGPHDHVLVETDAHRLVYTDARRFGAMDLTPAEALDRHKWLATLGPEPMDPAFTGAALFDRFRGRVAAIKTLLLDQRIVAGLGNIYVCEALFRAKIDPRRPAGAVSRKALERLAEAVRTVLAEAIAAGGSSLRDHRQASGELGYFQHSFAVYGREGGVCVRPGCGGEVVRDVQGGRSSFFCPRCQR